MATALYLTVDRLIWIIEGLVFVRVLLSWLPMMDNGFTRVIYGLTEPLLAPIRKLLSKSAIGGNIGIDFSPIILMFILIFIQNVALSLLF